MIHVDHNQTETIASVTGGVLMGVAKAMIEFGFQAAEVVVYGVVGGFAGMCGKWLWTKYVEPRLKKNAKG